MLANFNDEELTIQRPQSLEWQSHYWSINAGIGKDANVSSKPPRKKRNKALYDKFLRGKVDHLTPDEQRHLERVLLEYAHVWHEEDSKEFVGTKAVEHQLIVGDATTIRRPSYRTTYALIQEMQSQFQKMLDKGVIRESTYPWSAPGLLVTKKSLDRKPECRFCVDFRPFKFVTKFDA
jgi:hypothetical protein